MLQRLVLTVCVACAVASFSRPAAAFPLCEEGKPDVDDDDNTVADDRVILPCALADTQNGCADAAIYIVTNAGILLCQIDIPELASSGEQIDDAPASSPAVMAGVFFAAAVPTRVVGLPPVIVHDVVAAFAPLRGEARDGYGGFTTPPS